MSDVEPAAPARPKARHRVFTNDAAGTTLWVLTLLLAFVVAFSVVVWTLVSIDDGEFTSPWPLWVAGPPTVILAALYAAGVGRPRR